MSFTIESDSDVSYDDSPPVRASFRPATQTLQSNDPYNFDLGDDSYTEQSENETSQSESYAYRGKRPSLSPAKPFSSKFDTRPSDVLRKVNYNNSMTSPGYSDRSNGFHSPAFSIDSGDDSSDAFTDSYGNSPKAVRDMYKTRVTSLKGRGSNQNFNIEASLTAHRERINRVAGGVSAYGYQTQPTQEEEYNDDDDELYTDEEADESVSIPFNSSSPSFGRVIGFSDLMNEPSSTTSPRDGNHSRRGGSPEISSSASKRMAILKEETGGIRPTSAHSHFSVSSSPSNGYSSQRGGLSRIHEVSDKGLSSESLYEDDYTEESEIEEMEDTEVSGGALQSQDEEEYSSAYNSESSSIEPPPGTVEAWNAELASRNPAAAYARARSLLPPGKEVVCRYGGAEDWFDAVIMQANDDQETFKVVYEDGEIEEAVHPDRIRYLSVGITMMSLSEPAMDLRVSNPPEDRPFAPGSTPPARLESETLDPSGFALSKSPFVASSESPKRTPIYSGGSDSASSSATSGLHSSTAPSSAHSPPSKSSSSSTSAIPAATVSPTSVSAANTAGGSPTKGPATSDSSQKQVPTSPSSRSGDHPLPHSHPNPGFPYTYPYPHPYAAMPPPPPPSAYTTSQNQPTAFAYPPPPFAYPFPPFLYPYSSPAPIPAAYPYAHPGYYPMPLAPDSASSAASASSSEATNVQSHPSVGSQVQFSSFVPPGSLGFVAPPAIPSTSSSVTSGPTSSTSTTNTTSGVLDARRVETPAGAILSFLSSLSGSTGAIGSGKAALQSLRQSEGLTESSNEQVLAAAGAYLGTFAERMSTIRVPNLPHFSSHSIHSKINISSNKSNDDNESNKEKDKLKEQRVSTAPFEADILAGGALSGLDPQLQAAVAAYQASLRVADSNYRSQLQLIRAHAQRAQQTFVRLPATLRESQVLTRPAAGSPSTKKPDEEAEYPIKKPLSAKDLLSQGHDYTTSASVRDEIRSGRPAVRSFEEAMRQVRLEIY